MKQRFRITVLAAAATLATTLATTAFAADPCSSYKWNVSGEVRLFATAPTAAITGKDMAQAPLIETGRLYGLTLHPQQQVSYAASPSKPMLADGAFGGLLRFRVEKAGPHRVAIDAGFWLDVVHDGKPLQSLDFNGSRDCAGPRKIVVYDLPAGTELTLQIAAATSSDARLTVTPVAATSTP